MIDSFKLSDFEKYSKKDWVDKTISDLKGKDFNSLSWNTEEGFEIDPFYCKEERKKSVDYFRNDRPKSYLNSWAITQEFEGSEQNSNIITALDAGTQAITIAAQSDIEDYKKLLQGVRLDWIETYININKLEDIEVFTEYLEKSDLKINDIKGAFNYDPLSNILRKTNWIIDEKYDLNLLSEIFSKFDDNENFKTINIEGYRYGDSGASIVNELAYTLSLLNEYLIILSDSPADVKKVISKIQISLSIGSSYFLEIAKVKAFRILASNLLSNYGVKDVKLNILSRSSAFELNPIDQHANLLRLTSQAMSAAIAGSDGILLKTFDGEKSDFSQRMSRNIQLMLIEESNFSKGIDISSGSYSIEKIIKELSHKSWAKFKEIEANDGWIKSVENSKLQSDIKQDAIKKIDAINSKKKSRIGLNKNLNKKDKIWLKSIYHEDYDPQTMKYKPLGKIKHVYQ